MIGKAKQVNELIKMRSKAKKIQEELAQITESVERGDMRVKVSADQKVRYIEIDGERREDLEKLINDGFQKVQKKAAGKMMELSGGLGGLLGGS